MLLFVEWKHETELTASQDKELTIHLTLHGGRLKVVSLCYCIFTLIKAKRHRPRKIHNDLFNNNTISFVKGNGLLKLTRYSY